MPRKSPPPSDAPKPKPRKPPKVKRAGKAAPNNEHVPTPQFRAQVELAAGFGLPHKMIATLIGLGSSNTLEKHYPAELERGKATATYKVAGTLFRQATDPKNPNLGAAIFWLKAQAGWREKHVLDDPNAQRSLADLIALSGLTTSGPSGSLLTGAADPKPATH